jgi:hypothetical protein
MYMEYAYYEFDLEQGDIVSVEIDHQANVLLLDVINYQSYRNGQGYRYHGGWAERSPVKIAAPSSGHWYVVINLGGRAGTVRHSARVIRG